MGIGGTVWDSLETGGVDWGTGWANWDMQEGLETGRDRLETDGVDLWYRLGTGWTG